MGDKIKDLNEKMTTQEDSLMNITTNMSNLKVSLNETSTNLDSTIRDQDAHLERIEKLETDLILLKDEHDTRLLTLSSNINYVKDNYMSRP